MSKLIYSLLLSLLLSSCGGISLLKNSTANLYRAEFLAQIDAIKAQYNRGETEIAINSLQKMEEAAMRPTEVAMKRNLLGVIQFGNENFEQAIYNFDLALTTSQEDEALTAQVNLNLASSYYKLELFDKALAAADKADFRQLEDAEAKKIHRLRYILSKELGKNDIAAESLVYYLQDKQSLEDLRGDAYFSHLEEIFKNLDDFQRSRLLGRNDDKFFCLGYMGYLEAEKVYYSGDKSRAMDVLQWVAEEYSEHSELVKLVDDFNFRIKNYSKLDQFAIGVVLPLTGDKSNFGKRALKGIESYLSELSKKSPQPYRLIIRDSKGSGALGSLHVKELIEKHYVGVVLGGLFSKEAEKQYREAKRHGAVFISLSQVYIAKDQKDHLLVEVPGSVESQINELFSEEFLNLFGRRAAILYPRGDRGEAYVNEFWRKAQQLGVSISGALPFDKDKTDYRDPVRNLLGLKFERERKEELEMLKEIHKLEGKRYARRVQTLGPQIDFDWVFIPAFPREALQLLPAFTYYDAFGQKLIGGPSWRSRSLAREARRLGKLYFMGDNITNGQATFNSIYSRKYDSRPKLIEITSFDAMKIVGSIFSDYVFESRDELDIAIRSKTELAGITGNWSQADGLWLKKIFPFKIARGQAVNAYTIEREPTVEAEPEAN